MDEGDGGSGLASASSQRMFGPHGWSRAYEKRLFLSDAAILALVLLVAYGVRFDWNPFVSVTGPWGPQYWFVSAAIGVLWLAELAWSRSREPRILGHGPQEFQRVLTASWRSFAIIAIVGFLTQWQISRGYLLFAIPVGTLLLVLSRVVWRKRIHARRDLGDLQAQVLVVGPRRTSEQMVARLQRGRRAGLSVVGVVLPPMSPFKNGEDIAGVPVLGVLNDPVSQARAAGAEFILLASNDAMSLAESRELGWSLEGTEIGLIVAPSIVDVAGPRVLTTPVQGLPLMYVETPRFSGARYWAKAIFDKVTAAVMLLLLAIPMAVVAVVVKVSSRGPVIYRQTRVGHGMAPFTMYKFRSMYVDADQRLEDLRSRDEGNGVQFKMHDDPRVTTPGKFLRRFSVDELPQLVNVLKGDMSLVGPRPPLPGEAAMWEASVGRRQLVKPGITGLWQVSGRSDLDWDQAVLLDLYYAENWSLSGDLVILARTVTAIFKRTGAY